VRGRVSLSGDHVGAVHELPPPIGATVANDDFITLGHGGGGRLTWDLIRGMLLAALDGRGPTSLDDAVVLDLGERRLAFTTDSFVVSPLFFPGGDIGRMAVCGTVNDLAMAGARPLSLSLSLVIEEGLPVADLERILASVAQACAEADTSVQTGDLKVVERGAADGIFITTSGIGEVLAGASVSGSRAEPGDAVIVSGPLGDHGAAVLCARESLGFASEVRSDCAPLGGLVEAMIEAAGPHIHCLRDPTRGGLAAALNELASQSAVGIEVREDAIPVSAGTRGLCELLGLDPLHLANEGKLVAIVSAQAAEQVLRTIRGHPLGREAATIGEVMPVTAGRVALRTALGTTRILDMPAGELLPRIC
jgi:hydrogenase expression/formation protein HypE